jgi:hypothetical protein
MALLQDTINETHLYAPIYKQVYMVMHQKPPEEQTQMIVKLTMEQGADRRHYNLPTAEEIAAIVPGDGSEERSDHQDIVLHLQGGGLCRISHLHPSYACLHYILMFPKGEDGWHSGIPMMARAELGAQIANVSQRCFFAYWLHPRYGEPSTILWCRKLLQQFVVDAWASIEQNMLNWVCHHQKELRADLSSSL